MTPHNWTGARIEFARSSLSVTSNALSSSKCHLFGAGIQGGGGNHKALLIGINYVGMGGAELKGCHNDVTSIKEYISENVRNDALELCVFMAAISA